MWLPKLFNVFLWLFALDAGITTALDAYQALAGTPSTIYISLHTTVATLTTIAAILVLLAISSYRGTPWHMVLLPLIFVFWGSLVFIPLPAVVSLEKIFRFAAGIVSRGIGQRSSWRFSTNQQPRLCHQPRWQSGERSV